MGGTVTLASCEHHFTSIIYNNISSELAKLDVVNPFDNVIRIILIDYMDQFYIIECFNRISLFDFMSLKTNKHRFKFSKAKLFYG